VDPVEALTRTRTNYMICRHKYKMKIVNPCSKIIKNFKTSIAELRCGAVLRMGFYGMGLLLSATNLIITLKAVLALTNIMNFLIRAKSENKGRGEGVRRP
jgi:hypothetical protein